MMYSVFYQMDQPFLSVFFSTHLREEVLKILKTLSYFDYWGSCYWEVCFQFSTEELKCEILNSATSKGIVG